MKKTIKFLSILLAMAMIMSLMTVVASAEGGTEGTVVVFYQDFESQTDETQYPLLNGNRYRRLDGGITKSLISNLEADSDYVNTYNTVYTTNLQTGGPLGIDKGGIIAGNLFKYRNGSTYKVTYNLAGVNEALSTPFVSVTANGGGAGFADRSSLIGYSKGAETATTKKEWTNLPNYYSAPGTSGKTTVSLSPSWSGNTPSFVYSSITETKIFGYDKMCYLLPEDMEECASPSIYTNIFQYASFFNFIVNTRAYCGTGFTNTAAVAKNYKWKLTENDVCDHMPAISGGTYTKESILNVEWALNADCSSLRCDNEACPNNSEKKMLAAAKAADLHYAMDNIKWEAYAEFFDNTVSVSGGLASVDVVVNPTANAEKLETVKYEGLADGSSFKVNDYFDPVFTITPESGKIVSTVTYSGQQLPAQYNEADGTYSVTISAASVVQNGVLGVELAGENINSNISFTAVPVVSVNENGKYVVGGKTYDSPYTVIMYGKVIGAVDDYGFVFNKLADGEIVNGAQLTADSSVDGAFAIRVIGEGITAGTYKAWPFMTVGGATTENTEDVETITVSEVAAE